MYRILTAALLALLVMFGASTTIAGLENKAAAAGHYSVWYHGKASKEFHLFGRYVSEANANKIRRYLLKSGYVVQVRKSTKPIPPHVPRKPSPGLPANQTVTLPTATAEFNRMARQQDIAFRYPIDGCYARAELMIERMQKRKRHPFRVWSVANGEPLYARTKNVRKGYVEWGYHVAPVLRVRLNNNVQRWYVIDPSMFQRPVLISKWERAQMKTPKSHKPYVTVSRIGNAPIWIDGKRKNGHGYWPAADPAPNMHSHAVTTMKKYKAMEGKVFLAPNWPRRDWVLWSAPFESEFFDDDVDVDSISAN